MKDIFVFISEVVKTLILAAIIVIPVRVFLFQPFLVRGSSMEPNYYQGDYLIVDQFSYRVREPERGEVIVFHSPQPPERRFIKRIIGLPQETVILEEGIIYIVSEEGEKRLLNEDYYLKEETPGDFEVELSTGEYFVLGDNRRASLDSRNWGSVPRENIIGRVGIQISPFSTFAKAGAFLMVNYER